MRALYPPLSPLRWASAPAYYTDGAHHPTSHRSGASFYPTHHPPPYRRSYTVNPAGHHETNTITRAELCGIAGALDHDLLCPTRPPRLTIFTDSLASLYLIQSALRSPHTLTEKPHAPLQYYLRNLILARTRIGLHTHLQKVPSHRGVYGNELADAAAALALDDPDSCDYTMSHIPNEHFSTLPAWPTLPPPEDAPPDGDDPWYAPNLTSSLLRHIDTSHPDLTSGPVDPSSIVFPRHLAIQRLGLPKYNNHMWHTTTCHWQHIRTILQIRGHTLYTASSHSTIPYTTAAGSSYADTCPICPYYSSSPPPRDTPGHWLGQCSHPILKSAYIARHNRALCRIQDTISTSAPQAWLTIMDASPSSKLPPGVTATRLPSWLLPSLPPPDLARLRPDLLIFHGLSITDYTRLAPVLASHDPTTLAHLRSTCLLYIVELTYTSDEAYNFTLHKKYTQHHLLISLLLRDGWRIASAPVPEPLPSHLQWTPPPPIPSVSPSAPPSRLPPVTTDSPPSHLARFVHILIFTHSCTLPLTLVPLLQAMRVPAAASHTLLCSLAVHTVRSSDSIVRTRRRIERDPFTFSRTPLHRSFSHLHDPP